MTSTTWPPAPRRDEVDALDRARARLAVAQGEEARLVELLGAIRADLAVAREEHVEVRTRTVDAVLGARTGFLAACRRFLRGAPPVQDLEVLTAAGARVEAELAGVRREIDTANESVAAAERELLRVRGDFGAHQIADDIAQLAGKVRALREIDDALAPAVRAGLVRPVVGPARVSPEVAKDLIHVVEKLKQLDQLTNWRHARTPRGEALDRWRELGLDVRGVEVEWFNPAARTRRFEVV